MVELWLGWGFDNYQIFLFKIVLVPLWYILNRCTLPPFTIFSRCIVFLFWVIKLMHFAVCGVETACLTKLSNLRPFLSDTVRYCQIGPICSSQPSKWQNQQNKSRSDKWHNSWGSQHKSDRGNAENCSFWPLSMWWGNILPYTATKQCISAWSNNRVSQFLM